MLKYSFPKKAYLNYPIVAQAGLIVLLLIVLLGGALFTTDNTDTPNPVSTEQDSAPVKIDNLPVAESLPSFADISLNAEAVAVYEVRSEKFLYRENTEKILPIASITKLMTTLIVHETLEDGVTIEVPKEAVEQYGNSGMRTGELISKENLSAYALLSSSNDAAYALAYSVGERLIPGEGVSAFIDAMNVKAEELGLTNTKFQNPTGLDISAVEVGAVSSASDVSKLLAYIYSNYPDLLEPTRQEVMYIYNEEGEYHLGENTNILLNKINNIKGGKTGYTDLAGGNLTVIFDSGFNSPVVITALGSTYQGRFTDIEQLYLATLHKIMQND